MKAPTHNPIRSDWLATHTEEPLEPTLPIVDSHHHLYDRPDNRYLLDDILADLSSGHNVRATVYVQARAMLDPEVASLYRPVGETEFANGIAAMSASGLYGEARICAGIVGYADLGEGDRIRPVLEQHLARAGGNTSSGGRFCGIRQPLAWDADSSLLNSAYPTTEDLMDTPGFRAGFAHLGELGLSFDAWMFFHQLPRLAALARAFPEIPMVVDHCGGVVRTGAHAHASADIFPQWRRGIAELAACPNVMIKLSGLGMRLSNFGFDEGSCAPSSEALANAWRPWIETCLESFGASRCMYGSNFPVDKASYAYAVGINALKRLMAGATTEEKNDVFWRSAARFYRLPGFQF